MYVYIGFCRIQAAPACTFDRSGIGNCSKTHKHFDGCPYVQPFTAHRCGKSNTILN